MSPLPNYLQAISTLLHELDIDNVHVDVGRSLCARIGAYNHLPYDEWKLHLTMDLPTLKIRLLQYQDQHIIELANPSTQPTTLNIFDPNVWKQNKFDFTSIKYMTGETILLLIKSYYDHCKKEFDLVTVNTTEPIHLVYDLYATYHKHQLKHITSTPPIVTPNGKATHPTVDTPHTSMQQVLPGHNSKEPAPSKKRKVNKVPKNDAHMENRDFPTKDPHTNITLHNIVQDIFLLQLHQIKNMQKPEVIKYLQAYAKQYNLDTSPIYYASTPLTEMCEQLTQVAVELHTNCTP